MNTTNNIMEMMRQPIFTPLKEGKYTCKIEKVGINQEYERNEDGTFKLDAEGKKIAIPLSEEMKNLGYYIKDEPEGKNNNYFRLDLVTTEGKKTNRNVFPENIKIVMSNIKRQLNIEEDENTFTTLNKCLAESCELDMWIWYNASNKNVDFYDAITARDQQQEINESVVANLMP